MPDFQNDSPPVVDNSLALDWRAVQDVLGEDGHDWWVNVYVGDKFAGALIGYLNEPTARLIAAAPDMADALEQLAKHHRAKIEEVGGTIFDPLSKTHPLGRAESVLQAAGRAPQ